MATINVRVDEELKVQSKEILDDLGIDLSSAIKMFLKQVVINNGLPFAVTRDKALIYQAIDEFNNEEVKKFTCLKDLLDDLNS